MSLGVQRDVGRQTIVDVKYVSTLARHLATFRELEALPYGADVLGGGDGLRAVLTCDPRLPHDQRNVDHLFDASCFGRPVRGAYGGLGGNVGNGIVRGPGVIDWDATLFKRFPLRSEHRSIEFRWEAYNLFNHTQLSNMNAVASFNAAGVHCGSAFKRAAQAVFPPVTRYPNASTIPAGRIVARKGDRFLCSLALSWAR